MNPNRTSPEPPLRTAWWRALAAGVLGAVAVNLVLHLLAPAAGASLVLLDAGAPHVVTPVDVVVSTVVPLVLGTAAAVLLARWWSPALRVAQVGGAAVALATAAGPLTAVADLPTRLALASMHVVCAVAVVLVLQGVRRGRVAQDRVQAPSPAGTNRA